MLDQFADVPQIKNDYRHALRDDVGLLHTP